VSSRTLNFEERIRAQKERKKPKHLLRAPYTDEELCKVDRHNSLTFEERVRWDRLRGGKRALPRAPKC
jgi:hypothetical protein